MIRQCKKCKESKNIDLLVKKKKKDGSTYILYTCIDCNKKYNKDYGTDYYQKNKSELINNSKEWYQENIDKKKQYDKEYGKNNKDKKSKYDIEYRILNRNLINKKRAIYFQHRRKIDPFFKLRKRISASVWFYLKLNKSSKNRNSIINYLPYSIRELKKHIEKQFEFWMTWQNWGRYIASQWDDNDSSTWTWQLDHINPQSELPYTSMEDENFQKCWALKNLRPLSAKQNLNDGNRR